LTKEEIKIIDKKISAIQDPLGYGFPTLQKILCEIAAKKGSTGMQILREYSDWKRSKK